MSVISQDFNSDGVPDTISTEFGLEFIDGASGKQYAFMVSEEAHYSVARAVKVMGMGSKGIVAIPVDGRYRMRPEKLEEHFVKAKNEGVEVIGVVASSCATATGSYDPIEPIADFCESKTFITVTEFLIKIRQLDSSRSLLVFGCFQVVFFLLCRS